MNSMATDYQVDTCYTELDCKEAIIRRAYQGWYQVGVTDRFIKEEEFTGRMLGFYYKLIFRRYKS